MQRRPVRLLGKKGQRIVRAVKQQTLHSGSYQVESEEVLVADPEPVTAPHGARAQRRERGTCIE